MLFSSCYQGGFDPTSHFHFHCIVQPVKALLCSKSLLITVLSQLCYRVLIPGHTTSILDYVLLIPRSSFFLVSISKLTNSESFNDLFFFFFYLLFFLIHKGVLNRWLTHFESYVFYHLYFCPAPFVLFDYPSLLHN